MNTERLIAYGLDALSYYFIPHWAIEYAARRVAASNLEKAIENKCGGAGASNQADLQKELSDTVKTKLFYMPKFPSKIPLLGGKPMPIPWPGDPVLLMSLGGMTDNLLYKGLLYSGALAAISMSRGGLFLSNAPWVSGLGPVQNGKYSTALKNVTEKIQCNNEPPKGGTPVVDPEGITEIVPSTADEATPATGTASERAAPFQEDPPWKKMVASNMVSSAQMAGIPVTDLSSQLAQVYGSSRAPSKATLPGQTSVAGNKLVMPIVPLVSPVPVTLPQVRMVPVVRPMPVLAR